MTDDITVGGRTYYKDLGEWRIRATEGSVYDPYVGEYWNLLDEIEHLRAEVERLTQSKSVNLYEESLALTLTDIATWDDLQEGGAW